MSENRLTKFVEQAESVPPQQGPLTSTPIVVADSKGKYLKPHVSIYPETEVLWINKSGRQAQNCTQWLIKDIDNIIAENGRIHLYLWLGTCDLCVKEGRYIFVRQNLSEAASSLKQSLKNTKDQISRKQGCDLTFLHIPYCSTAIWNELKGHTNPQIYTEKDKQLTEQIDSVNSYIDELNSELGSVSPKFNLDLVRSRKKKGVP